MSVADQALEFFLADAKAQGLTLAAYEKKYGLVLDMKLPPPAKHKILRHETSGGVMNEGDFARAKHRERHRA